jgi:V8-like Glu-specific endopeptidase
MLKSPLLFILLTLHPAMAQTSPTRNLADRYDDLSCSLVRIASDDGSYGTGFFVDGDGTIVTAAHVVMRVEFALNFVIPKTAVIRLIPKSNLRVTTHWGVTRSINVTTTKNDEDMASTDLAVIRTNLAPHCHLEVGNSQAVRIGTHLIAMGYPAFDTVAAITQPKPILPTPALYDGFLSSRHVHMPIQVGTIGEQKFSATYEVLRLQMPVTGGVSGGPVIADDDKVVGVVTEETAIWPPELTDYAAAVNKLDPTQTPLDKIKLPSGKEVDSRQILGALTQIVHEFESPGAGLAVPTLYLKLSVAANH